MLLSYCFRQSYLSTLVIESHRETGQALKNQQDINHIILCEPLASEEQ